MEAGRRAGDAKHRHTHSHHWAGWAVTDAANCIPRLLTHNSLSWVIILSLWLCYHFLVGFVHFLSPGSTLQAEPCESDRGICVNFRKKSSVGKHLCFNQGTFDLVGFPVQIRSRVPEQLCQHKQGTAHHDGWMGGRGKFGSRKTMPVEPKAGQVGTTIPHLPVRLKWSKMSPRCSIFYELLKI